MRAKEFITETNTIPKNQQSAVPGMVSHPHLDNSSPYHPWRFAAHFLAGADGRNPYEFMPDRDGPNGQSLVTVAFTSEEDAMLRQAEKAFGSEAKRLSLSPPGSREMPDVNVKSTVAKPKKNKYGI